MTSFTVAKILRVLKQCLLSLSVSKCFTVAKILRVLKRIYIINFSYLCFTVAKILRVLKLEANILICPVVFYSS